MSQTWRANFTPAEKVKILPLHLIEKRPISDLEDEFGFRLSKFYDWQKRFFEQGAAAFAPEHSTARD